MHENKQSLFPHGCSSTPSKSRGWTIIALLVGVLIVLVLYVTYFKSQSTALQPGVNAIDTALEEAERQRDLTDGVDPANKDATPTPKVYQSSIGGQLMFIDRARAVKDVSNLKTVNDNLMMWTLSHPGQEVTIENLQQTNFNFPALKPNLEYYIVDEAIRVREKK